MLFNFNIEMLQFALVFTLFQVWMQCCPELIRRRQPRAMTRVREEESALGSSPLIAQISPVVQTKKLVLNY